MKLLLAVTQSLLLAASLSAAESSKSGSSDAGLKNEEQKTLYTLGVVLGRNIAQFSVTPAELKYVSMGLHDSVAGTTPKVDLSVYGPKLQEMQQARQAAKAEGEKNKSKSFLESAAQEKGALKLPSGVVYVETKAGKGAKPLASDTVRVHYHGTLTDGSVFDSSVQRGSPAEFPLNGVIPCWTEGVQKMKVGGKAKLVCPSATAYGDAGSPPRIAGGATLVFEVELLDIIKK